MKVNVDEIEPGHVIGCRDRLWTPAVLGNGVRAMVPPHLGAGTRIVVDSAEGARVERAKG